MDDTAPRSEARHHPFARHPHRTLLALSAPVLVSLIAEPLTGLVDTAFVARLGSEPLAALGVAATGLSTVLWIFNFLGIGTQTEVGRALGGRDTGRAGEITGLAMTLGLVLGAALGVVVWPLAEEVASLLGAEGGARTGAAAYLRVRLLGGPAVLATFAAFGALRGLQDMKTPLWIALGINAVNIALDAVLIFGLGPFPQLGLVGAAWASTMAQWLGAAAGAFVLARRLRVRPRLAWGEVRALLAVGRDLFFRSGSLLFFMAVATRVANALGPDAGAAHQALRQLWMLAAFVLDAYAASAQSLVSYFLAAGERALARRVAVVTCGWGLATGAAIALAMGLGSGVVAAVFVPASARAVFAPAWIACALAQPLTGLSFVTDGIHWGTADYRYLRNGMFAATGLGAVLLLAVPAAGASLTAVWVTTGVWIAIRSGFGVVRIWPGRASAPLGRAEAGSTTA